MTETVQMHLYFEKGYIANPYWPEREELINIQKASGLNRARTEKKREEALVTYLKRLGLTREDYTQLEALASRPWYRAGLEDEAEIVLTSHQLYGCLIESAKSCPAAIRPCEADNLRHVLRLSEEWPTGKLAQDGVFKRLVMPKSGTGQPLSNQRSLRVDPYITKFTAIGRVSFRPEDLRDEGRWLQDFFAYAGDRTGVGASRKMGWGRFVVTAWQDDHASRAPQR